MEASAEDRGTLHYGDVISLRCVLSDDGGLERSSGEPLEAHLSADGFADREVTAVVGEGGSLPEQFQECLFEVLPKLQHSLRDKPKQRQLNRETAAQHQGTVVKFGGAVQLRHVPSNKFVTVRPRKMARVSAGAMRIELDDLGDEDSVLTVRARYKLRQEGAVVHYGDEIMLHNVRNDIRINCSRRRAAVVRSSRLLQGDGPQSGWLAVSAESGAAAAAATSTSLTHRNSALEHREVNAASSRCGWRVKLFSLYSHQSHPSLRSGDVVRLMHTESGGLITCEAWNPNTVHIRVPVGSGCEQSHSGGLWQLEMPQADAGGVVSFGRPMRFRHLDTGFYMAAGGGSAAQADTVRCQRLTKEGSDSCNFECLPTDSSSADDTVNRAGVVYLRSAVAGWVHAPDEIEAAENERRRQWVELVGQKFFEATTPTKRLLQCHNSSSHEGAFSIIPVVGGELSEFRTLHAPSRHLQLQVRRYSAAVALGDRPELERSSLSDVARAVEMLIYWLKEGTRNGEIPRRRQKLMREFLVLDTLVDALKRLTKVESGDATPRSRRCKPLGTAEAEACALIYQVLMLSLDSYDLNEFYVANLGFSHAFDSEWSMLQHLGMSLGAEHLLSLVLSHNTQLVRVISPKTVETVIGIFVQANRKETVFLEFLIALCSCGGRQVKEKQNLVGRMLTDAPGRSLLLTTRLVSGEIAVEWTRPDKYGNEDTMIETLESLATSEDPERQNILDYYNVQLSLFCEMCYGRDVPDGIACVQSCFDTTDLYSLILKGMGHNTMGQRWGAGPESKKGKSQKSSSSKKQQAAAVGVDSFETDRVVAQKATGGKKELPVGIQARVHSAFCHLMIDLLLDTAPRSKAAIPTRIWVWPDVGPDDTRASSSSATFSELIEYIQSVFQIAIAAKESGVGDPEQSQFTRCVLRLCRTMIGFGFYVSPTAAGGKGTGHRSESLRVRKSGEVAATTANAPLQSVTEPLVQLLQRKNDAVRKFLMAQPRGGDIAAIDDDQFTLRTDFKAAEDHVHDVQWQLHHSWQRNSLDDGDAAEICVEIKVEIIKILQYVLTLHADHRVAQFLDTFYAEAIDDLDRVTENPLAAGAVKKKHPAFAAEADAGAVKEQQARRLRRMRERFAGLIEQQDSAFDLDLLSKGQMATIARGMIQMRHPVLTQETLKLLSRQHSQRDFLAKSLLSVQLITDPKTAAAHVQIQGMARRLRACQETSEVWLRSSGAETSAEVVQLLTTLSSSCLSADWKADSEKQSVMLAERVHSTVVTILDEARLILSQQTEAAASLNDLFRHCCRFLRHFCLENSTNQMEAFHEWDGLHTKLTDIHSSEAEVSMCTLLESIVKDNPTISKQLNRGLVTQILELNANNKRPEFLRLLGTMVHCEGRPNNKDFAAYVVRSLSGEGRTVAKTLFRYSGTGGPYNVPHEELVHHEYSIQLDPLHFRMTDSALSYEICLTELLCKCSDEDNYVAETICQDLLTLPECCAAVQDAGVAGDYIVKGVFLHFMDQVYWDVEEPLDVFLEDELMWDILKSIANEAIEWAHDHAPQEAARAFDANAAVFEVIGKVDGDGYLRLPTAQEAQSAYMVSIVLPALLHFVQNYDIPPARAELRTLCANAAIEMLEAGQLAFSEAVLCIEIMIERDIMPSLDYNLEWPRPVEQQISHAEDVAAGGPSSFAASAASAEEIGFSNPAAGMKAVAYAQNAAVAGGLRAASRESNVAKGQRLLLKGSGGTDTKSTTYVGIVEEIGEGKVLLSFPPPYDGYEQEWVKFAKFGVPQLFLDDEAGQPEPAQQAPMIQNAAFQAPTSIGVGASAEFDMQLRRVTSVLQQEIAADVEREFHQLAVQLWKQEHSKLESGFLQNLIDHGDRHVMSSSRGSRELITVLLRILRHEIEEEPFVCMQCGYSYDMIVGDEASGVKRGTSFVQIDGLEWKCPQCKALKSSFTSQRHLIQESMAQAGAVRLAVDAICSLQPDKLVSKEPFSLELHREACQLACTLLSGHNRRVVSSFYDALKRADVSTGSVAMHPFTLIVHTLLQDALQELATLDESAPSAERSLNGNDAITGAMWTLQTIQALSGGHDLVLQEVFLSNGVVNEVAMFVRQLVINIERARSVKLITIGIEALADFVEGPCSSNQEFLAEWGVIELCNDIMQIALSAISETSKSADIEDWCRLLHFTILLLLALVERRDDTIIQDELVTRLDFDNVAHGLIQLYQMINSTTAFQRQLIDNRVSNLLEEEGKRLVVLYFTLVEFDGPKVNAKFELAFFSKTVAELERLDGLDFSVALRYQANPAAARESFERMQLLDFFAEKIGQVEINWNGTLVRSYFPIPRSCYGLERDPFVMKELLAPLTSANPAAQQHNYLDVFGFLREFALKKQSDSSSRFTHWLRTHVTLLRFVSTVIAFAANGLLAGLLLAPPSASGKFDTDDAPVVDDTPIWLGMPLDDWFYLVCWMQVLLSTCILVYHIMVRTPTALRRMWASKSRSFAASMARKEKKTAGMEPDFSLGFVMQIVSKVSFFSQVEGRVLRNLFNSGSMRAVSFKLQPTLAMFYSIWSVGFALQDVELLWNAVCAASAVLSVAGYPAFAAVQMFNIVLVSEALNTVMQSIYQTRLHVAMTLILILIITYIYSIGTFYFLREHTQAPGVNGTNVCSSLSTCLWTSLDSIRTGGSGAFLNAIDIDDTKRKGRISYDLSYFLIVTIIMLNMLLGIIIDSFAMLRREQEKMQDNQQNSCWVCCFDRRTIEEESELGFDHHINVEHSIWQYLYFYVYVHEKRDSGEELSGMESFFEQDVNEHDTSFMPLYQALGVSASGSTDDSSGVGGGFLGDARESRMAALEQAVAQLTSLASKTTTPRPSRPPSP